jgi:hypothetical protein
MILLCGIPSEPPLAFAAAAASRAGVEVVVLNQRRPSDWALTVQHCAGGIAGQLLGPDGAWPLGAFTGVYLRMVDAATLPEPADRDRAAALHDAVAAWTDVARARVANRARPSLSNASKPHQTQLIARCGLAVPETLVTNDPSEVLEFTRAHRRVVFKSMSGARSIVTELSRSQAADLWRVRDLPTQFQALVDGTDVRVHVAGGEVFATEVRCRATDYRYAERSGEDVTFAAIRLPPDVRDRCLAVSAALELPLAGIDLRRTPDGAWVCFEVNPSPAYSYYQEHTGQPIAESLVAWLAARDDEDRSHASDRELGRRDRDHPRAAAACA